MHTPSNPSRRIGRRGAAFAAATGVALVLSACGGGSGSASDGDSASGGSGTTAIRVAYTPVYSVGAIQLGIDQGFFKAEGLTVALQQVANPPAGIAAVAGGQVQFNYAPSIPVINAVANGVALKVAAAADGFAPGTAAAVKADPSKGPEYDDTAVLVQGSSPVQSPKDLSGKTISIPARKAQLEVTISGAVKDAGGDPSTIKWITLDFPSALSSLKSGRVDASGVVSPFISQGIEQGARIVSSPAASFFGDGAVGLWVTSAAYAQSDADTVQKYMRAIAKSNEYANEHVADAQAAAAKILKADINVVKAGSQPYFPTSVDPAGLADTATKMTDLGFLAKTPDTASLVIPAS